MQTQIHITPCTEVLFSGTLVVITLDTSISKRASDVASVTLLSSLGVSVWSVVIISTIPEPSLDLHKPADETTEPMSKASSPIYNYGKQFNNIPYLLSRSCCLKCTNFTLSM